MSNSIDDATQRLCAVVSGAGLACCNFFPLKPRKPLKTLISEEHFQENERERKPPEPFNEHPRKLILAKSNSSALN
jgi:hypothetical protein